MPDILAVLQKVKDVLSQEVGERKVFDKDVAEALGINQLTLATMKNRSKIPYKEILEFCAKRKISINWLLFDQIVESLQAETDKYARIHYFRDIYASAGGGALNEDESSEMMYLDEEIVQKLGGIGMIKHIQAINVLGDSMEPTLFSGDVVFINQEYTNAKKAGIYVVSTPAGLFIKRLQLHVNGTVALVSDNEAYAPEIMDAQEVNVLGKVVGKLSCNI
ncbi:LexA family transcriptional regulator [Sulfurospirillum sp. hDNRA2]|uniref:LexA family transcriptional regulator n=1 Tax=Sulfurospirillum sp. hDNRA2 TaxID=3237298 RepID=UPI0020B7DFDA|nr:LexA family transcriptional regulator [Sulfurospirillum sp. DNRA8]MCP3651528.1 helix-turn-helix domain-containing protein [Sulfurospirillum sp. DNRA8]MCR1810375.1 helix-turn-helix domain-containing protein [Sulfurospirillum sp. DNRA8]